MADKNKRKPEIHRKVFQINFIVKDVGRERHIGPLMGIGEGMCNYDGQSHIQRQIEQRTGKVVMQRLKGRRQ